MSVQRLFIAIRIPEEAIAQWPQAQIRLKKEIKKYEYDAKWTIAGNYHVSLFFLGPTGEEQIPIIQSILSKAAAQYHPFKLDINGIGAYADITRARLLYLGVQNKKILRALQSDIMDLLKGEEGSAPRAEAEVSEYVPHLTIVRFRDHHSVKDLISPFLRKKWGEVMVSELVLFKSEMRGVYPVYIPIFTVPLTGTATLD